MDLSMMSTADLQALQAGDMSKVSDAGLKMIAGPAQQSAAPAPAPASGGLGVAMDLVGNFVDAQRALRHHVANLPHGLAQLVENGIAAGSQKLTDLLQPNTLSSLVVGKDNPVNRYIQQTVAADNAAMAERERAYQAKVPDSPGAYAGAAVGEVAPWLIGGPVSAFSKGAGDVAANVASKVPVLGGKVTQAAANGAAQGAVMGTAAPVTGEGDYWAQKKRQAEVGAAAGTIIPGGVQAAKSTYGVAKDLLAPIVTPKVTAGATLTRAATADAAAAAPGAAAPTTPAQRVQAVKQSLAGAQEFVPGSQPTTAQVAGTPEMVQLEKAFGNTPEGKAALMAREIQNNNARISSLERLAGTDKDLENAIQARSDTTKPLIDSLLNNPKTSQPVNAAPILRQIAELEGSSFGTDPVIKKSLAAMRSQIQDASQHTDLGAYTYTPSQLRSLRPSDPYVRPDLLDGIRQNLRNIVRDNSSVGAVSSKQEAGLSPLADRITSAIEGANPGYRDYLAAYAKASEPVNAMEAARTILAGLDGGRDSLGNPILSLTKYNSLLKKATGGDYPLPADANAALIAIQKDLQRASISSSVRQPGSDTLYNANVDGLLNRLFYGNDFKGGMVPKATGGAIGGALGALVGHPVMGAAAGAAGASKVSNLAAKRFNEALSEGLLNPKSASQMMLDQTTPLSEGLLSLNMKKLPMLSAIK